jgi:hypothetical protein
MIDHKKLAADFDVIRARFSAARPFPHVVIDGAMHGDQLANAVEDWPAPAHSGWRQFQKGKRAFATPAMARPWAAQLMRGPNQRKFVEFLAALTGIADLAPDHELHGGGLHEVEAGGSLGIHVDFNRLGELHRRVNVLVFLNRGWQPNWNGALELWPGELNPAGKVVIEPTFNRMVIFEASEHSWHGHPLPLACPEDVARKSAAFYYYSREPHPSYRRDHSTVYQESEK